MNVFCNYFFFEFFNCINLIVIFNCFICKEICCIVDLWISEIQKCFSDNDCNVIIKVLEVVKDKLGVQGYLLVYGVRLL